MERVNLLTYFLLFVLFNLFLYCFILLFHNLLPFFKFNYVYNSHHYFEDPRINGGEFNFLRALGQYDAQWYLKIASEGYPKNPKNIDMSDKTQMDGLTYAFFPLYPLLLNLLNIPVKNLELTAFLFSNLIMILNFFSMYFVIGKLFSKTVAIKTIFLLFLFPFSIFYRSYFTEGLQLLFLVWFSFFLTKGRFIWAGALLGLLNITKGNAYLLNAFFVIVLLKNWRKGHRLGFTSNMKLSKLVLTMILVVIPSVLWVGYNFFMTGEHLYFLTVRRAWSSGQLPFIENSVNILLFHYLPVHNFHYSKIDVYILVFAGFILALSKKSLNPILWSVGFCLWLGPLLVTNTMSFSRYQTISFPLFIYLSNVLRGRIYAVVLTLFTLSLLLVSTLFVNWYWIG